MKTNNADGPSIDFAVDGDRLVIVLVDNIMFDLLSSVLAKSPLSRADIRTSLSMTSDRNS